VSIYQNQVGIINIDEYDYLQIAIIGVGSIGSCLAIALNKLGFKNIIIIDDDKVEKHNPTTQFYFNQNVNQYKVHALSNYLNGHINHYVTRVKPSHKIKSDVVFICVDSLKQRKIITKAILDSYKEFKKPTLIIDGRMHRLMFRVFTVPLNNQVLLNQYVAGILGKEFRGSCTEKGIIQNVFAVVSVMVEQFKKTITGEEYYAVINCDLERYEFIKNALQDGKQ